MVDFRERTFIRSGAIAAFLIGLAVAVRLSLIALGVPTFDSDEGTMGLMALHINALGERPIFFYGQAYMGALEAYLAAVSFRLLGVSDFTLRLGVVALDALFLAIVYRLVALLYNRGYALLSLAILSLGSSEILARQLKTVGGYPELMVFGSVALLIASSLSLSATPVRPFRESTRRLLAFGAWGLVVGLGLWSDPLMLPFAAMSGILLLATCRGEIRGGSGFCAIVGLALGLFPVVAYNVSVSPDHGTMSAVLAIVRAGGSGHTTSGPAPLVERLAGFETVSLPAITGGNGLCTLSAQDAWPVSFSSGWHTAACTAVHGAWGLIFSLLWLLAVLVAGVSLWGRRRGTGTPATTTDRRLERQQRARLAVLGTGGVTVILFLLSSAPAHAPWNNVRYLTGLWIALPAVIAPLTSVGSPPSSRRSAVMRVIRCAAIALLGVALLSSTIGVFGERSYSSWLNGQLREVVADLHSHHVTHVYTDYWTCDWLAFETRERITCAVLGGNLEPSLDRYLPYRAAVHQDRRAWYVFRSSMQPALAFARLVAGEPGRYRSIQFSAFTLYQPVRGPG